MKGIEYRGLTRIEGPVVITERNVNAGFNEVVAEKNGMLWGVGSIIAFLVIGGLLLLFVKRITVSLDKEKPSEVTEDQE